MQNKQPYSPSKKYLFFISQDYSFPVLRPLQDAIWQRGHEVRWFMYGNEIHKEHILDHEVVISSIQDVIAYSPDAVFVPGNVVPSFIPGLKVEVFHGLPGNKTKKNGVIYHYIIRGMFDLYCTQGPRSTDIFKSLAKKYKYFDVEETGWCKLDPLFPLSNDTSRRQKKSIFFASTFSPRYSKAKILHPFLLKMAQEHDYQWYITLHPKMPQDIVDLYTSITLPNVKFIYSTEVIQYFKKSDLMLCDISSITYEFATQLKPVITFQSPQTNTVFVNIDTLDELEKSIINILNGMHKEPLNIETYVHKYHPYQDGKSSQRVLNCVEKILDQKIRPSKKKPLNFIRNFKLRKALNYWVF